MTIRARSGADADDAGYKAPPTHVNPMSDDADTAPCDWCGDPVTNPLARTVRVTVDRSQIDSQRLCPECFADWIDRFDEEMTPDDDSKPTVAHDDTDIIVD